jgi:teichuronic acid biosynthesis glycosyltransferase TuaG
MPCFNNEAYVSEAIASIQRQSYQDWELFVIDDCSTDGSLDVIRRCAASDPRIHVLVNTRNAGPGVTRNRGITAARGRYLAFMDSDDLWDERFLEVSLHYSIEYDCPFVFSSYNRLDEQLQPLYDPFIVPKSVTDRSALKTCPISCLTTLLDIGRIGKYYMPELRKRQDYVLWLSILKDIDEARGIREVLASYRIRKGSVSRNKLKAMFYVWRVYRDYERLSVPRSAYYLATYSINGLRKYHSPQ